MRVLRKITQQAFTRDWRFKTLVPVIVINVLAFAGLYALMYHFAVSNLIQTHRRNASIVFDEFQLTFEDRMIEHSVASTTRRLVRQARAHGLTAFTLYDPNVQPLASLNENLTANELQQAASAIRRPETGAIWNLRDDNMLTFATAIQNVESCHSCHDARLQRLGAVQVAVDLTKPLADARRNVRHKFALAGVAWLGILGLLFWTARIVIGRPLEEIGKSVGEEKGQTGDLAELAQRVHHRIWAAIDEQKKREENIARQLVRAKQLAALGELAAGLTHEIKNPIAGVMSALELLRSESDVISLQNAEVYEQVINELRRVSQTLDSLLRLAKPQPPQRVDVDMARVVRELTSLFAARFRRLGVVLEVEIPESLPLLQLDPSLMAQLIVNLLTNSMQATDRGGQVKVLTAPFPRRDGVVLVVSDSGHGIPPELLERIFDPFFTTKEEGTGLGLAICRQIVEQHGGTISLESEMGQGTRVVVLLPKISSQLTADSSQEGPIDVSVVAG